MTLYRLIIWKRMLEDLLMLPFIWWGRLKARRHPLGESFDIFFIFPFYHIGGAEKVHSHIAAALKNRKAIIFFTRKSQNEFFLEDFKKAGHRIIDISTFTDNKWKYWNNLVYRGMISSYINHQPNKKLVFNGQSNFGYKLSRWIKPEIPQIELIHSLSSLSYIRIPFLPFFRETVMISRNRIDDHLELYRKFGIPRYYNDRIKYIINGIPLPEYPVPKTFSGKVLKLLYAGRDTPEKRVHLAREIGHACILAGVQIILTYMGDVSGVLSGPPHAYEMFYGNVGDPEKIDGIYQEADVLLITSSEEGFPMVVMEAMARGCIILATPVGDIPVHIRPGINGFLFTQVNDEKQIINEGVKFISKLLSDPALCAAISANNIKYAREHFGLAIFEKNYQELFHNYIS
jgi:glycosyltransferase involved in cell wall biosynthesis